MKNNINKHLTFDDLYNGDDERIEIVRAIFGFFMIKENPKYKELLTKFVSFDAHTYTNKFAISISALAIEYSNKRANNMLNYFFDTSFNFNNNQVVHFIHLILYPENAKQSYLNYIKRLNQGYLKDFESIEMALKKDQEVLMFCKKMIYYTDIEHILQTGKDNDGNSSFIIDKEV